MVSNAEIAALLRLIEDPDTLVFNEITKRIFAVGMPMIPSLEAYWESHYEKMIQERVEWLIHKIQYHELKEEIHIWANSEENPDLFQGALLAAKYQYPDVNVEDIQTRISKLKKMVWIELSEFLTPIEQFHIVNSVLYHFFNLKGVPCDFINVKDYCINEVLSSKRGNAVSNGLLFLIIALAFGLPIRAIDFPDMFLLAVFHSDQDLNFDAQVAKGAPNKIHFYVDATSGNTYTQQDIDLYMYQKGIVVNRHFFAPLSHTKLISILFEQMALCFKNNAQTQDKMKELLELSEILNLEG